MKILEESVGCADANDDSGVNIGPLGAMPAGSSLLQEHCVGEGVVSSDMGWGLPNFAGALAGMGSYFLLALGFDHTRALPFPRCRPDNTPKRSSQPLVGILLEPSSRMWPCFLMGSLGLTFVKETIHSGLDYVSCSLSSSAGRGKNWFRS